MRDIRLFNLALVGKRIWRILEEKESLWVKVIESKYGSLGKRGVGGESAWASIWWRDICRLFWGVGGVGLRGDFSRELGDGRDTVFWDDLWVDGECLKEKFPRLFRLSRQKKC